MKKLSLFQPTRRRRRAPRAAQRGLTRIEILVVGTSLGLSACFGGVSVFIQLQDSLFVTARLQLQEISKSLDIYKIKNNRYPSTTEGLQALVKPPGGKKPIMDTLPKDPRDGDYIYVSPGSHNPSKFDLSSKGPDGVADTEDDVTNWRE